MRKVVAAALVFALAAGPVRADLARDAADCANDALSADRIIEACTTVVQSTEPSADVRFNAFARRAAAYFTAKGDYERAVADASEAIKLKPEFAAAYAVRGGFHLAFNEFEKAIADFDEAIKRDPSDAATLASRAYAYVQLGQDAKAVADYSEVIRLMPGDANAYYDRGGTYEKLKEFDKARADYEQAIKLQRDYAGEFPDTCFASTAGGERTLAKWPACEND